MELIYTKIHKRFDQKKIRLADVYFQQSRKIRFFNFPILWSMVTRFLYCPRCGLRKPASEIFGYYAGKCPSCGCKMIPEGSLPYIRAVSKSLTEHPLAEITICINKEVLLW